MHYERLASLILDTALPHGARLVSDLLSVWDGIWVPIVMIRARGHFMLAAITTRRRV